MFTHTSAQELINENVSVNHEKNRLVYQSLWESEHILPEDLNPLLFILQTYHGGVSLFISNELVFNDMLFNIGLMNLCTNTSGYIHRLSIKEKNDDFLNECNRIKRSCPDCDLNVHHYPIESESNLIHVLNTWYDDDELDLICVHIDVFFNCIESLWKILKSLGYMYIIGLKKTEIEKLQRLEKELVRVRKNNNTRLILMFANEHSEILFIKKNIEDK